MIQPFHHPLCSLPMLQDYQLLMVAHVNTYGHMLPVDMTIAPNTIPRPILFAHVPMRMVRVDHLTLLM